MNKPYIIRRSDGEYSTTILPDGTIETCWFADDGTSRVIGRFVPPSLVMIARQHVTRYERED